MKFSKFYLKFPKFLNMRVLSLVFVSMVLVSSQPSDECRGLMDTCRNEGNSDEICRQMLASQCGPNSGNQGNEGNNNSTGEETQHESDTENHDMDPAGVWKVADMENCVQNTCDFSIHPDAHGRLRRRLQGEAREGWDEEIFAGDFNHSFVGRPDEEQLKCICEKCSPLIEKQLHTLHCSPPGKDEDGNFRTTHKPCDLNDKEATAGAYALAEKLLGGICPWYARYNSFSVYDESEIESQSVVGWTYTVCTHLPTGVTVDECDAIYKSRETTLAPIDCTGNPFAGLTMKQIKKDKALKKLYKKAEKHHTKFSAKLAGEGLTVKQVKKYTRKLNKAYDVLRQVSEASQCPEIKK